MLGETGKLVFGSSLGGGGGGLAAGIDGGSVLGACEPAGTRVLVSILSSFGFCPDSRLALTPPPGEPKVDGDGADCRGRVGGLDEGIGGGGNVETGGGGGSFFDCIFESNEGSTMPSASVDREAPAVVVFDATELPQVLPEKLLESDCRGSADLDCRSNSKSSIT